MKRNKLGFTLIELLVVVLVIGILAAVAIPQYQKALEKSRATEAITLTKSLAQAANAYYLANGKYPEKFNQLDIELPPDWTGNEKFYSYSSVKDGRSNGKWSAIIERAATGCNMVAVGHLNGPYKGGGFIQYIGTSTCGGQVNPNTLYCVEIKAFGTTIEEDGKFCHLFGGILINPKSIVSHLYQLP